MKNKVYLAGIACLIWVVCGVSCSKKKDIDVPRTTLDLPDAPYDYGLITPEMGQLGRVIFYDKTLSVNNAISCGTCHKQAFAFSDNTALSTGFENMKTSRNAPPIQNLAPNFIVFFPLPPGFSFSNPLLFWDGRESVLQTMVLRPVFNHVEMGARTTTEIVSKLKERPYYADLFAQAFGDNEITFERIARALSDFTGSISSNNSKFDMVGGVNGLNAVEQEGFNLFFGKYNCGSCHNLTAPNGYNVPTSGTALLNIGLNADYSDNGLGALNGNPADDGKFKIPSLRNVMLTGPYMHDGRFTSMDDVLEHYSSGIANHPNLDDRLKDQNGNALAMNITEADKHALTTFLNTLTDNTMTTDPKFSDPFKVN